VLVVQRDVQVHGRFGTKVSPPIRSIDFRLFSGLSHLVICHSQALQLFSAALVMEMIRHCATFLCPRCPSGRMAISSVRAKAIGKAGRDPSELAIEGGYL
jgi:hypothetical protein